MEDERCCGSGTCLIDPDGRCWCGQVWDGRQMAPPRGPAGEPGVPHADDGAPTPQASTDAPKRRAAFASGLRLGAAWLMAGLGLGLPLAAAAADLASADTKAVRAVVEAQLAAMAAGDGEAAFARASPAIRGRFGDAARFMAMVKGVYPMLMRPAGLSFLQPRVEEGGIVQQVQLRDREGRYWLATYALERQPDASWRIGGCTVVGETGKAMT